MFRIHVIHRFGIKVNTNESDVTAVSSVNDIHAVNMRDFVVVDTRTNSRTLIICHNLWIIMRNFWRWKIRCQITAYISWLTIHSNITRSPSNRFQVTVENKRLARTQSKGTRLVWTNTTDGLV